MFGCCLPFWPRGLFGRGRAGRLAGLLVAWVACGMAIDPSDTKFEGLGASRLRLPAGSRTMG